MNESKIMFEPTTGCWLWAGDKFNTGYGRVCRNRKGLLAHRLAWSEMNGPIPEGAQVWIVQVGRIQGRERRELATGDWSA